MIPPSVRNDFPILNTRVYGRPLTYLDNGATTQKPVEVVEAMRDVYFSCNANVHRGVHYLSVRATELLENAREAVRGFIGAASTREIVFTRGTTESINLVASSFTESMMKPDDEVIVSQMEHHSNIVPWQLAAARHGIGIKVAPISDEGTIDMDAFRALFSPRTRMVSLCHVSNVLGTVNPIAECVRIAHRNGVPVLVDGAQSTPHMPVDVRQLGCDFFVFSSHKVYGPTGIGVLYGKEEWLDRMPPYQGGGEMIQSVSFERTVFQQLPYKFEAGTPDYVAAHGLKTALDYVSRIGFQAIEEHERRLTYHCIERLREIEGIEVYGPSHVTTAEGMPLRDAVVSFNVGNIHNSDIGTLLDRQGIAVRTGHHCAEPLMHRLGILGTVRASYALYNTTEDTDRFIEALKQTIRMF